MIAYNRDVVPDSAAPRDWDDVLAPRWKDRLLIRDPMASGTMRAIWGMLFERSLAATGDTAQAAAWLRRLDGQTREYVLNPALLHREAGAAGGVDHALGPAGPADHDPRRAGTSATSSRPAARR